MPNNAFAIFPDLRDQPVLADGVARFRGEAVLALVGDEATLAAIADADVPIRYTPLAAPEASADALAAAERGTPLHARYPDNVLCRGRVVRGDVDAALATASHRAGATFETRHVEHAYIEPEAGYAEIVEARRRLRRAGAPLRRVRIFACTQTPYMDRDEIASVLKIAPEQVHIVPSAIGGGFGGKLDLSVQPLVAVAAWKLGRAVRLVYERPESMQSSTKRHPATMQASAACDADGRLVAFDFAGDFNTGAYSSWGPTVANRVPIHASGPYRIANVRALTRAVLTHNSVAGAFRGFGVPQSTLLGELLIDELAARAGMRRARVPPSQRARRRRHDADRADARGERRPAALPRCAAARVVGGDAGGARLQRRAQARTDRRAAAAPASPACGTASATPSSPTRRRCAARLRWSAERGAHLFLYNGAQEIGQGTATIMPQMFADAVGLRAGVRRAGDGRHRPDGRRRQVVGVAPDLRLGQRRQGRGHRSAPAADRAARLRRSRPTPTCDALALDGDRLVGRSRDDERASTCAR